ncbi:hypothetical protein [Geobacter sp. AOG2]|uniref:hypothetical protein n=1 Tax=Geobacter sp. AOG2 TaxID=1566347 RepID=UPI001CC74F36|nr:hypothetical protein [Geobacter sp. AOG2]GFE59878.1 hypothetical protein AOG2_04660 [Geobacter sp. AOG2]
MPRNTSIRCRPGGVLTVLLLGLVLLAGCAGAKVQSQGPTDYVEVSNPAQTMSPSAPETIWVPRKSVDSGLPRAGELVKRGYEAVTNGAPAAPAGAGIAGTGGKPAAFIPRFGLVVAAEGEKVYFNLGKAAGITPFQKLKVYRGGTVVEGLGLAPGELVATIEVQGFVGTNGAYGIVKQGGQVRVNDLVGGE